MIRVMSCTLKSGIVWTSFAQRLSRPVPAPPPNTSTINCTWCRHGIRQTGVKWPEPPTCFSPAISPTVICVSPSSFRSTRPTCGVTNLKPIRTTSSSVSAISIKACLLTHIKTFDYFAKQLIIVKRLSVYNRLTVHFVCSFSIRPCLLF